VTHPILYYAAGACALAVLVPKLRARLRLSRAKHRSLAGHSRMARRFASLVPYYEYDAEHFFRADAAPDNVAAARRAGFMRLAAVFTERFRETADLTADIVDDVSDLQFTSRYRVPFQFSRFVREHLKAGVFLQSSSGVTVTDMDGNRFYDLTGSYGVNLFGYDFYKDCIARGSERVRDLGPVLGAYHPITTYNIRRLLEISGLDEISFHMSGTEAVMQAVRLARYHTGRGHLVRFCGAYHGWWGDVQPGVGNPIAQGETYTLQDMDDAAIKVLRTRSDIACVLVNPLQALHPNVSAPGDSTLVDSGRRAHFDRAGYSAWLGKLREACSERGIVLIFDEVFIGFRLGVGGAQAVQGEMKMPPPNMPAMPANWQGMVGEVEKALRVIGDKVRKVDESQLNTTVKFMTGPKQHGDLRRLDVLWFLLNDQIHHRGQFSVYLRMAGGKVPSIYGPSADEKWM